MLQAPEQSQSLWQETKPPVFPSLTEDVRCDVCVIGGGITGLSVAYHCLREGRNVVVIDRDQIGGHETGHTSAHLSSALDDSYQLLWKLFGTAGMRLAYESHSRAIDQIEEIIGENGIECEFQRVNGYLFLDPEKKKEYLVKELEAVKAAGGDEVSWLERFPNGVFDVGPVLCYPRQAQFHPLKYLYGLAAAVSRLGGRIFTQTPAIEIKGGKDAHVVTSRGHKIGAEHLVVATNVPINDIVTIHTKIAAYRSYLIAIKIPPGWLQPALLWDTADPYHYVRSLRRPDTNEELLLIGGADHRTGQQNHPDECYESLRTWTRDLLGVEPVVVSKWSGQIIEPADSLAYIGRNPGDSENVFIATGDSGHGLTHGTIAGMLLSDLIEGRENPWSDLYEPSRLRLRGLDTYVEENMKTAAQYGDWVSSGDVETTKDIPPGHGAVIRYGFNKAAVYRDEHGHVHCFSAVCPHLKGIIHWNESERTWDCPCHGSRWSRSGKVLNGPAIQDLTPIPQPELEQKILIASDRELSTGFNLSPDLS